MRRRRDDADVAELAALADGSIAPERRADLEARVGASTELADALAEQQRALTLTRGAAAEVEAPSGLRARVGAERNRSPAGRRRAARSPSAPSGSRPSRWPWPSA